jgi:hypothetical protein
MWVLKERLRRGTLPPLAIAKREARAGEEFANGRTQSERGKAAAENRPKRASTPKKVRGRPSSFI